jgi:hypothetical protein
MFIIQIGYKINKIISEISKKGHRIKRAFIFFNTPARWQQKRTIIPRPNTVRCRHGKPGFFREKPAFFREKPGFSERTS